jgi:WD40 repeat protein
VDRPGSGYPGAIAELKQRWQLGAAPLLEDFLQEWSSECADRISERELVSLISLDQRERWRLGQRPAAEEYLQRFPQLAADDELALDVIYGEFLLREELGERPEPREYLLRFPELADTLQDQIEFHQAMAAGGSAQVSEQDTHRSELATQQTRVPKSQLPAHLTHFVPGYELLSELGRGGMGVVYRARQLSLNRLVALKMLRAGDCGSAALLARFQAEAEAVARLHHPNIVQIYDYGEHDGMPYLALELVEGCPLSALPSAKAQSPREAAEIVVTLARAVQFAHEQGIVHRDLKPANVLVKVGASRTTIKVTDFGLAKVFREGEASHTQTGTIVGTPSYMAPEQARGRSQLIGPATDVYALGAILYELLAGQPPFKAATAIETLHQVLTIEADSAVRQVPALPRDLATIAIKCLQKDPHGRYGSAAELADDLQRFLEDRPVRARPVSAAERAWRWCRRNPVLASLAGSVAALLVAVAAVLSFYSWRLGHQLAVTSSARQAEGDALKLAELRLWESYLAQLRAGRGSHRIGQRSESMATVDRASALLDKIGRTSDRVLQLRNATIATLVLPDLRPERIVSTNSRVSSLGLSVAADRYVAKSDGEVAVHRLSDGELLCRIPHDTTADPSFVDISVDGCFVSTLSNRGVKIWRCDADQSAVVGDWPGVTYCAFSPDSKQAVVCHPANGVQLIDLATGQPGKQLLMLQATARPAFHKASQWIAVCTKSGVSIIDWPTGRLVSELPQQTAGAVGIAWHPSGEAVVVCGLADGVELWSIAGPRLLTRFPQGGMITRPHFSHDGCLLWTLCDWSGELRLWNTGTGQEVLHSWEDYAFVADDSQSPGDFLIQLRPEGLALWKIVPGLATNPLLDAPWHSLGDIKNIAVSPDGRLLAIGRAGGFDIWDLRAHRRTSHSGSPFSGPVFEPGGDLLIACRWGLYRWPCSVTKTGEVPGERVRYQFGPPQSLSAPLSDGAISTSSDGNVVAVIARTGWQIHHLKGSTQVTHLPWQKDVRNVAVSPDGAWVSLVNWGESGAGIWDASTGERLLNLPAGRTGMSLFSPDGRWLALTPDGVRLWHVSDWKPGPELHAHGTTPSGLGIAFSPDSKVLAVSQPDQITRLVDPGTGIDWAELWRPDSKNSAYLAFTPDQSQLIEIPAGDRGAPRIWNLVEIRKELARLGLDWPADVLKAELPDTTSAEAMNGVVTLDDGNLANRHAAETLIRQAASAKDDEARKKLEQAIQLDPENAHAHNDLAWLIVARPESLRDPPTAVTLARRAVQLDGSVASYWNTLGVALYRDGKYSEAVDALKQSLDRGSDSAAGYDLLFLALCHFQLGNTTLADDYFKQAQDWHQRNLSRLSPLWKEELSIFFAEAQALGLPKHEPTK